MKPRGAAYRLIVNGVNGIVVRPFDIDGLADGIARLAGDPDLRHRLALRAAEDAWNYTYERVGLERAQVLSKLIVEGRRKD